VRVSRGHLAIAAAVAVALATSAAAGAQLRVLIGHTPNKTGSNRTAKTIDAIVIHDTEGRFVGSVRFLQRARARGSAHFVVSRRGQIVQLVPVKDVAWHAGNRWWNLHAIGIEHEGWAGRGAYTVAEYRASAQLVAYLAHRWGIPIDRRHIVGHAEVPNPSRPGQFGGISGHTDPGQYWNWRGYMWLVRYYAAHPVLPRFVKRMTLRESTPPPVRSLVQSGPRRAQGDTVVRGAQLRGHARWWSGIDAARRWRRHIYKVDFLVDGRTLYTDHTWPYSFRRGTGWDSTSVANGRHMLTVLAFGTHRYRVRKRIPVRVANPPLELRVEGVEAGDTVDGSLALSVRTDPRVDRVALYVDGTPVSRDGRAPFSLRWETTAAHEGDHDVLIYARARNGRRAAVELPVVVANSLTFPPALAERWPGSDVVPDG
jgi:N-acetyl-anhydromuramyl-L-alanine amidase AmpD